MAMQEFGLNMEEFDRLQEKIRVYPQNAERKITEYLHGAGYDRISHSIQNAIPVSDRNTKRHAKFSNALRDKDTGSNLSVIVSTKQKFHYLYFPDDGSNTLRHAGNQRFFEGGLERVQNEVVNGILGCLDFEE